MATALAYLAVVLTVVVAWPQAFRAWRSGTEGIAPTALLLSLLGSAMWFGYGMSTHLMVVVVSNASVFVAVLVTAAALVRARALDGPRLGVVLAGCVAAVVLAQVHGVASVVAGAGAGLALLSLLAQGRRIHLDPAALEGVSLESMLILCSLSSLWLFYGIDQGAPVIIVQHLITLPLAIASATIVVRSQRAAPTAAPAVEPVPGR